MNKGSYLIHSVTIVYLRVLEGWGAFVLALIEVGQVSESPEHLHSLFVLLPFFVHLELSAEAAAADHESDLDDCENQESSAFLVHVDGISPALHLSICRI